MHHQLLYKILAIVAGLVIIGAGINENRHISRLKRFGSTAVVTPPATYMDHSQNGSHTYTGDITFKTGDGGEVKRKHSIPEKAIDSMKAGEQVVVYYDPRDASDFVFAQEESSWLMPLAGVALIIGALIFLRPARAPS